MGKRASTEYSHLVGIDKPAGLTSHDVVNRVRRMYGERRVGHMGTLDPAATGVLLVCVGPATRLDAYLGGHAKSYEFTCVFGTSTDTDDAQGNVVTTAPVDARISDIEFARTIVEGLVGSHRQLPPAYSAIKVNGTKSYDAARAGKIIDLQPRDVEIYQAKLLGVETLDGAPVWRIACTVSAGTYIRSLARDIGVSLETVAYVGDLRRTQLGDISAEECVSLEALEADPFNYLIDPVRALGLDVIFASDDDARDVSNGKALAASSVERFYYEDRAAQLALCSCASALRSAYTPAEDGQHVCVVIDNRLKAIYAYDATREEYKPACVFSIGVQRGTV